MDVEDIKIQPITITAPPPQQILTLALPIQNPRPPGPGHPGKLRITSSGGDGGGREDCWSEGATSTLIDAWGERYMELSRGNLTKQHWKDVSDIVTSQEGEYGKSGKTDVQCKNRIDTLKKKYKSEKSKIETGQGASKWLFYNRMDYLIGMNAKVVAAPVVPSGGGGMKGSGGIPVVRIKRNSTQQLQEPPRKVHKKYMEMNYNDDDSMSSRSKDRVPSPESNDSLPPITTRKRERGRERERKRQMSPPKLDRQRLRPKLNIRLPTNVSNVTNSHPLRKPERRLPPQDQPKKGNDEGVGVDDANGGGKWSSIKELSSAIMMFGQAYERAETAKVEQLLELEKHRMEFMKELETQRMHFYLKSQVELNQFKHERRSCKHRHMNNIHRHHSSVDNRSSSD